MTEQEALQEFWDNALHPSLKPEISEEAKSVAMKALEKQIPKKPKCPAPPFFECPMCKAPVGDWQNHCENCGQALDWEGYRDENQPRK